MKTPLLTLALALLSQGALAAPQTEHACDKFALDTAQAAFGPMSRLRVVSALYVAGHNDGAMGENIDIKVTLKGDVNGYLLVNTAGEGDSDDCNLKSIVLRQ